MLDVSSWLVVRIGQTSPLFATRADQKRDVESGAEEREARWRGRTHFLPTRVGLGRVPKGSRRVTAGIPIDADKVAAQETGNDARPFHELSFYTYALELVVHPVLDVEGDDAAYQLELIPNPMGA